MATHYKIALVGEAYGAEEEKAKAPFIGKSGQFLNAMLLDAGIKREECFTTNVFNLRPQANDIKTLCGPKDQAIRGKPALSSGKYVRAEFSGELRRLAAELERVQPNLVVALGGTASWALLDASNISKLRGCCALAQVGESEFKVLPTYHPAAVLREYDLRAITVMDFMKAAREREFPELHRVEREIFIVETAEDLRLLASRAMRADIISYDIENNPIEMTCIGFAFSEAEAWVIPLVHYGRPGNHYWQSPADEKLAHEVIRAILALPATKVAQNQMYDLQWLWMRYGVSPNLEDSHDTMLLHHAMHPELEKGLGFLGSIYCNEVSWKTMRPRGKHSLKREE